MLEKTPLLDSYVGEKFLHNNREVETVAKLNLVVYIDQGEIKIKSSFQNNTASWDGDPNQKKLVDIIKGLDPIISD